jgi:hypothetical protein
MAMAGSFLFYIPQQDWIYITVSHFVQDHLPEDNKPRQVNLGNCTKAIDVRFLRTIGSGVSNQHLIIGHSNNGNCCCVQNYNLILGAEWVKAKASGVVGRPIRQGSTTQMRR